MLVLVSHEGGTPLTLEAAQAFAGPKWLITGKPESAIAALSDEVLVVTPEVEESYCHTASVHLRRRRARGAPRRGRFVAGDAVASGSPASVCPSPITSASWSRARAATGRRRRKPR